MINHSELRISSANECKRTSPLSVTRVLLEGPDVHGWQDIGRELVCHSVDQEGLRTNNL